MAAFQEEPAGCVNLGGCQSMAAQTFQFDLEGGRGGGGRCTEYMHPRQTLLCKKLV